MGLFTRKERVIERVVEKEKIVEKQVVKYLLGDPEKVTLYLAYREKIEFLSVIYSVVPYTMRESLGLFHSCAQAFESHPGCKVEEKTYWKLGDKYLKSLEVAPVSMHVTPKPKRPKGKVSK